ncbi:MAG: SGNH/GDSL hydrolase family protein [Planctomycetia bacterium]|nr:SGNH/GDSL hydrolase family protein [Planctomycetia bacterium]
MKLQWIFPALLLCCSVVGADDGFYQTRRGIPNSLYYFEKNITGNRYVFCVGSEILTTNHRYTRQILDEVIRKFPDTRPSEISRIRQPGGSRFAQYWVGWGQPVFGEVICSGHLAILEFAPDDVGIDEEHLRTTFEGLLRQIHRYRKTHSILVVYTLRPDFWEDYKKGKTPDYIRICEEIAAHYDVPSLNLAKYASEKILAGAVKVEDFGEGCVHLNPTAHKVYGEAVNAFMAKLLETPVPENPSPYPLPEKIHPKTNDNGRIVAYDWSAFSDGWKTGMESPCRPFRSVLQTEKPGETLTLPFRGTAVGIIGVAALDAADLEYRLDDGAWKKVPSMKANEPQMAFFVLEEFLDDTAHLFTLRTASAGTARIGGILLNGTAPNPLEGLTRLEQIDKIYAGMDPIVYTPDADRFQYLPETMKRLKNGPEIRMVLLGDSIIGNTMGSQFNLLLARDYPNCKITAIGSTRSSTGCWYYKEENRIEDYVLRHEPDLLIIGGISNRDAESVRSVVRQVRARRPNQEILILTPVFGAVSNDAHIKRWTYEIDTTTDNLRYGLYRVAKEEKCAFFDMTGPWWKYIQDSGKTPGWFYGDAVHANGRGCQIIGRLLEIYFRENAK